MWLAWTSIAKVKDGSFWSLATRIDLIENAMKPDGESVEDCGLSMAAAANLLSGFCCALKSILEEFLRADLYSGEVREARLIALARQLDQREGIVASGPRKMIEEFGSTRSSEKQLRRARALVLVEILNAMLKNDEVVIASEAPVALDVKAVIEEDKGYPYEVEVEESDCNESS